MNKDYNHIRMERYYELLVVNDSSSFQSNYIRKYIDDFLILITCKLFLKTKTNFIFKEYTLQAPIKMNVHFIWMGFRNI